MTADPEGTSAWDERAVYWPPPDAARKSRGYTLRRAVDGTVYWSWETGPETRDTAVATRQDPKLAMDRLREVVRVRDELRAASARTSEAVQAAQKLAMDTHDRYLFAQDDLHAAEATVLAFIRTGELP